MEGLLLPKKSSVAESSSSGSSMELTVRNPIDGPFNLETLASMRSLLTNPSTPKSSVSSILETLTRSLQLSPNPLLTRYTLKLLSDLAFLHPDLSSLVFDSVRNHSLLSTASPRLAAESLELLASISEYDPSLSSAMDELDDRFFVSFCFAPSLSVRLWLLQNAERFRVRPSLLFTVFFGFTKDPYPYVRRAALDGLVRLCCSGFFEDPEVIEGCYFRAVELLRDMEDCVRSAAICAVSEWGRSLVSLKTETDRTEWSDIVFVQLCSMVRDMSMDVRVKAFDALGRIQMVSQYILLQTLSKKVQGATKGKTFLRQFTTKQFEISVSSVAGAFVHGLEDDFYEVRKSACYCLRTLTSLSDEFAGKALSYLTDVLNDDSVPVRLQALETMCHMAASNQLKVQESHMHMFLGAIVDKNSSIRAAARKTLKFVKLLELKLFKLSIDSLLEDLEIYPQDEADVLSLLFHIGRNHGKFAIRIINGILQEIEPASEGKSGFDSVRVAALLVLAISVPLSEKQHVSSIPPRIFSYAVTLLGRISISLNDVMDQSTLLAYLSQCSRCTGSTTESNQEKTCLPMAEGNNSSSADGVAGPDGLHAKQIEDAAPENHGWILCDPRQVTPSLLESRMEMHDEVIKSMNFILAKVKDMWPLIQSGCTGEVLRTLRVCREELATYTTSIPACAGAVTFTLQYIRVMKLVVKVWSHYLPARRLYCGMGQLGISLGKLDRRLKEMRYRFIGFSEQEELHILELVLLTSVLRLSEIGTSYHATMRKLSATMSRTEFLCNEVSVEPSNFLIELKKLFGELGTSYNPLLFKKTLDFFSLKQFTVSRRLKHINAELNVPGNDFENPLPFVPGLPVSISFEITLNNVSSENRLWLKLTLGEESTLFLFLDANLFECIDEVRRFSYTAPFYRTPRAASFTLKGSIGMECLLEDADSVKGHGGPKHELTYLCPDREVFISVVRTHHP